MHKITPIFAKAKPIFDRLKTKHPWENPFSEMDKSGESDRQAISSNWRMDHRVAEGRESAMLSSSDFNGKAADMETWLEQMRHYWQGAFCRPFSSSLAGANIPVYLDDNNQPNLLATSRLPGYEQLIHVASFNGLLRRVMSDGGRGDFRIRFQEVSGLLLPERFRGGFMSDTDFKARVDDLARALLAQRPEVIRETAGLLIDGLGSRQPHWWACFAEEVAPLLADEDWSGLCKALGLGHIDAGEWVLIWRYQVGKLGFLYRPTVVEAKDSPFHFPSPPVYEYGITMPLAEHLPACREIIHPPLPASLAEETCTGQLGQVLDSPMNEGSAGLPIFRRQHAHRLVGEFSESGVALSWLKRHSLVETL